MRYFKLMLDTSEENDIVCHSKNDFGIGKNELITGKRFENWNEDFKFYYNNDAGSTKTDLLSNDNGWLVVSEKLKNIFENYTVNSQYFSVTIAEAKTNENLESYFIVNVLNTVGALNLDNSDYYTVNTTKQEKVNFIKKYAVNRSKLVGENIFKLQHNHTIPLFVSEEFKNMVEQNYITGMAFLEIKMM